jgi:hypothetical protein
MILSRIAQHVREQNWTAIGIDFVIVVLGVFLGIQLGNWNARRPTRGWAGPTPSASSSTSAPTGRAASASPTTTYDAVNTSAEQTARLLGDPAADPRALVVNAYRATEYTFLMQTRPTWDEIVSSGNVDLLPRAVLESGVSNYYAYDWAPEVLNRLEQSSYRRRVRSLLPHPPQEAIRTRCSDVRDEARSSGCRATARSTSTAASSPRGRARRGTTRKSLRGSVTSSLTWPWSEPASDANSSTSTESSLRWRDETPRRPRHDPPSRHRPRPRADLDRHRDRLPHRGPLHEPQNPPLQADRTRERPCHVRAVVSTLPRPTRLSSACCG